MAHAPLSHKGLWHSFTTTDGLASLQVEYVAQDASGYLWFGTWDGGVSRFDGQRFETFTTRDGLAGNRVYAIHLDRSGRLWLGARDGGLTWHDGTRFHRLLIDEVQSVTCIFEEEDGKLWFCGENTLGYYDGRHYTDLAATFAADIGYPVPTECWGIARDRAGIIWLAFVDLVRCDGALETGAARSDAAPAAPRFRSCGDLLLSPHYALAAHDDGGIWLGGTGGIGRYDGEAFQPAPVDITGTVRSIQRDREGRTWFCYSGGGGVVCHDGARYLHWTTADGLAYDWVNTVCQDREGLYWFATWGGGISCFDPNVQIWREKDGLPQNEAHGLLADAEGRVWVGYASYNASLDKSIACWDGDELSLLGEHFANCRAIHQTPEGDLFFGGHELMRYDGDTFALVEHFVGSGIADIAADAEGRLYMGHSDPSFAAGNALAIAQITRFDGRCFQTIFSEEGKMWFNAAVGYWDGELFFALATFFPETADGFRRLATDGKITSYTTADGLVDNRVSDFHKDRHGTLWIATLGGLSAFDGQRFRNFTIADGLPNNHVRCIYESRSGDLFFGTDSGGVRYDGNHFQTIHLPGIASVNRIVEDHSGALWFATHSGIVRYRPGTTRPSVRIREIAADQIYQDVETVEVSTTTQQVTIAFGGMSFRTPMCDLLYAHRLRGRDSDWQPPTRQTFAHYQDLPPGEYTFQVVAIDRDLNHSPPAEVLLRVVPDPLLAALTEALSTGSSSEEFVGQSPALLKVQAHIAEVAPTDLTVLIQGETGTGKGLAARTLHQFSARKSGPFIQINCGAIPRELVESELFGHEKGAFTGATTQRLGKVELARGGTLFLDEVGDLPLEAQVKILRLLEDGTFDRVGSDHPLQADIRLVAATNRDLEQMIDAGSFRRDLYYRLRVFPVHLPALRERQEDIPLLTRYIATRYAQHLNRSLPAIAPAALTHLTAYDWPGNVRELEHFVKRAVLLCKDDLITVEDLAISSPAQNREEGFLTLAELEKRQIERALAASNGVVFGDKGAAQLLGINPQTLRYRLRKHGLQQTKKDR